MKNKTIIFTVIFICIGALTSISAQTDGAGQAVSGSPETSASGSKKQKSSTDQWTGFYIGGYGGGSFGRSKVKAEANSCVSTTTSSCFVEGQDRIVFNSVGVRTIKPKGFEGGVSAGYDHQNRNFVYGFEASFGAFRNQGSYTAKGALNSLLGYTITQTLKTNWLFTARPRVGVVRGKTLIYGNGGLAATRMNYKSAFYEIFKLPPAAEVASFDKLKLGWTVGGGAEVRVSDRWSLKGEYLYTVFGKTSITANQSNIQYPNTDIPTPQTFAHTADLKTSNVRFGVSFHF